MEIQNYWLSFCSFTDTGIVPQVSSQDLPLSSTELEVIANYYSIILNYAAENSLIGPLPVAYHPDMYVLIYRLEVIDSSVKDERVVQNEGKTVGFLLLFFKTSLDDNIIGLRKFINSSFDEWSNSHNRIEEYTKISISVLEIEIEKLLKLKLKKDIINIDNECPKLFIRQLEFLSKYMENKFSINIISDSSKFLNSIKESILKTGWNSINSYIINQQNDSFEVIIENIVINCSQSTEIKTFSQKGAYIYFAEVNGLHTKAQTVEYFKKIVNSLNDKQQFLLNIYPPSEGEEIMFEQSPIFEELKSAIGKNILLKELKDDLSDYLDSIVNFMYHLIEKQK